MNNSIVILGSGNSLRNGDNLSKPENLEIWSHLNNIPTFGINWIFKYYFPTIVMYADSQFYETEKENVDKHPLVIGKQDGYYKRRGSVELGKNIILLPITNVWQGEDSWKKGFYCSRLTGIIAITLAYCLGFKNIYLLGFDNKEIDGRTHFYQGEPKIGWRKENDRLATGMGRNEHGEYNTSVYNNEKELDEIYNPFLSLPTDVRIINVSPQSRITAFNKLTHKEFYGILDSRKEINQDEVRKEMRSIIEEKIK